jgi:hypothetical protein
MMIDVSTPTNPTIVGFYEPPEPTQRLYITDSNIYAACGCCGLQIYEDLLTGISRNTSEPVQKNVLMNTIIGGPLLLPEGKICRVFDITGRVVVPQHIKPGIYFIEIDGKIERKVVKVR